MPRLRYNSPVILTFSLLCLLVLFIPALHPVNPTGQFGHWFVVDKQFSNFAEYITYFTYIFGHANAEHLMGNLTFILLLGPIVEEKYGGGSLMWMILVTAVATALAHNFIVPGNVALLGASGIVFMLIILVSFTNVHRGQIPVTFILVAILFIGKELLAMQEQDNISQLAHIIGGVCGGIFGFTIGKPRKVDTYA